MILFDGRIPQPARRRLEQYGEAIPFSSSGITYPALSGHPDIFFAPAPSGLVTAPNVPVAFMDMLACKGVRPVIGRSPVGGEWPATTAYNCVFSETFFIHNLSYTDMVVREAAAQLSSIHCRQGYTRCSLVHLGNDIFLSGDAGVTRVLQNAGAGVLGVSSREVVLPGFRHGFFGGACGVQANNLLLLGSLDFHPEGNKIREFTRGLGMKIIELYHGPLFDGGSILFIETF